MNQALKQLMELGEEIKTWHGVSSLLGWDQETQMPAKGVGDRSKQSAVVSTLIHEKMTADKLGNLLEKLGASEESPSGSDSICANMSLVERSYIRYMYKSYRKSTCLPASLVKELSETQTQSQAVWAQAKQDNDFPKFQPWLEKIIALKRKEAEAYGYEESPYDPLLDDYEPGMKTSEVTQVFSALKADLVPLVQRIADADQVDNSFLCTHYPAALQEKFGYIILEKLGYPLDRGNLRVSAHPFTSEIGNDDVRITTRYLENFFNSSLFSIIHEAGHAFYELGIGSEIRGNMLSSGTSLGIHESQSRTWENIIGRSMEFWQYFLPLLKEVFPENLASVNVDGFWRGVNKVEPSFIRVEADEVTYSLHVMLRFELEQKIIRGEIAVKDLPEAWNEGMREMLGIVPSTNSEGVLQDVHWSFGLFGYFPTYALGNLYGSQFWNAMLVDLPNVYDEIAAGTFTSILNWLGEKIHRHGSSKTANELSMDICGEPLNHRYFMDYLNAKYSKVYSL